MLAEFILSPQNIRTRLVVGVSIEPRHIRVACLARSEYGWELYALHSMPLSQEEVHHDNGIRLDSYLAHSLAHAWQKLGVRHKQIAISIAKHYVVTQEVTLPPELKRADLEIALLAQAEKMLPFTVSDIAMDYQFNPGSTVTARLAVCQKQQILRLQSLARAAGLKLIKVEDETAAGLRGAGLRQGSQLAPSIQRSKRMDSLTWAKYDARYDVACGVAIDGGFNLTPWRNRVLRERNLWFGVIAIVVMVCAQIPVWVYQQNIIIKQQQVSRDQQHITERVTILKARIAEDNSTKQRYQEQIQRAQTLALWAHANEWLEQILEQLPNAISTRLRLERLRLATPASEIHGYAEHASDVSAFAVQLTRIPAIRKAELGEIRSTEDGLGNRFSVRLWIDLEAL
jgi:Tfp pilus assembly protein PilN